MCLINNYNIRLTKLQSMNASQEITDDESRDLLLDLDNSYNGFNRILHEN